MENNIQFIADVVTIIGLPLAIFTIFIGIQNQRQTKKVEQGGFLLELRKMFASHNEIHLHLRNEKQWKPQSSEDWSKVDSYLGLFELCEILIQNDSLSKEHFESQYKYRLENILANKNIVSSKLIDEALRWDDLLKLINRLKLQFER